MSKLPDIKTLRHPETRELIECSFCEKTQYEVEFIIQAVKANICDECVDVCVEMIAAERRKT